VNDLTLQINLSIGDIVYARATIPPLVEAHRKNVYEKLAIVDCCRPQKTKLIDPDEQFSASGFSQRVSQICSIAEELKGQGYFDRIVYFYPNDPLFSVISRKYLRNFITQAHDWKGVALMTYLAAFEVSRAPFVLHYDADMFLYQEAGYDWLVEAKNIMDLDPKAVAATPRIYPPLNSVIDPASLYLGKPMKSVKDAWYNEWFGARCFLMDLSKLRTYLPLLKGRFLLETVVRKYLNRSYPPSVELMISRSVGRNGGYKLYLKSKKAWLLHPPLSKTTRFIELLPRIQQAVSLGKVPPGQGGYENINSLSLWEEYLGKI
jgi:hypothetical protein